MNTALKHDRLPVLNQGPEKEKIRAEQEKSPVGVTKKAAMSPGGRLASDRERV
jgi:hypothetical protein